MEIELNERESEILTRVVDGPEIGTLAEVSEATVACKLYLYGLVTLREGMMRPTNQGIHVVATARVRARVDRAERELSDAAVAFGRYGHTEKRFDDLCRAARAFVRAETTALAVAKQQDATQRFHVATDVLSSRKDGQT